MAFDDGLSEEFGKGRRRFHDGEENDLGKAHHRRGKARHMVAAVPGDRLRNDFPEGQDDEKHRGGYDGRSDILVEPVVES